MLKVVWQLDSGHKTFLPRLGGGLTFITRSSVDAACYVISQADNTVRMVSALLPCLAVMTLQALAPDVHCMACVNDMNMLGPAGMRALLGDCSSAVSKLDITVT